MQLEELSIRIARYARTCNAASSLSSEGYIGVRIADIHNILLYAFNNCVRWTFDGKIAKQTLPDMVRGSVALHCLKRAGVIAKCGGDIHQLLPSTKWKFDLTIPQKPSNYKHTNDTDHDHTTGNSNWDESYLRRSGEMPRGDSDPHPHQESPQACTA